jgi:hypothetical protein
MLLGEKVSFLWGFERRWGIREWRDALMAAKPAPARHETGQKTYVAESSARTMEKGPWYGGGGGGIVRGELDVFVVCERSQA